MEWHIDQQFFKQFFNKTMSRSLTPYVVLNAKGATGIGNSIYVGDFETIGLQFATDGGGDAALTVKFQGSMSEEMPAFGSAQSVTNIWDYKEVIDLEDGAAIDGDTGVAVASADDYREFELNVNGLNWINAVVTARTAGEVTVLCVPFSE